MRRFGSARRRPLSGNGAVRQSRSGSHPDGRQSQLGRYLPALQRERLVVVKLADAVAVEALLADLKIGARQRIRGKLLDGEFDCLRGIWEPAVSKGRSLILAVMGREKFRLQAVIEREIQDRGRGSFVLDELRL